MTTLVEVVFAAAQEADQYHFSRSLYSIGAHMQSEMGEVAEEIAIANGDSYKSPGPDGIDGEAIDLILAGLDLLYVNRGRTLYEDELITIAQPKLAKWLEKIKQGNQEGKIK
jgi:NTP pyrophosphatase (non-canonical NTP hydrolase)